MAFVEPKKYCPRCERWKEESLFARDKNRIDGLNPHCKMCHRRARLAAGDTQTMREK